MKKSTVVFLGCAVMVLVAAPLYGQTGCTDSPENPTVVLALVGGAGGVVLGDTGAGAAQLVSSQR